MLLNQISLTTPSPSAASQTATAAEVKELATAAKASCIKSGRRSELPTAKLLLDKVAKFTSPGS